MFLKSRTFLSGKLAAQVSVNQIIATGPDFLKKCRVGEIFFFQTALLFFRQLA
jgi:hypothetical protein